MGPIGSMGLLTMKNPHAFGEKWPTFEQGEMDVGLIFPTLNIWVTLKVRGPTVILA